MGVNKTNLPSWHWLTSEHRTIITDNCDLKVFCHTNFTTFKINILKRAEITAERKKNIQKMLMPERKNKMKS